jgi:2,5-furandicarboxylate decarboxylase 1
MPLDLRHHLEAVRVHLPEELLVIEREIDPAFEVNAVLQKLADLGKHPVCLFTNVRDLKGQPGHKVVSNLMASRRRLALALELDPESFRSELPTAVSERVNRTVPPDVIPRDLAPVMEVIKQGDDADLYDLPVIRQHELDGGHYLTMGFVNRDLGRPLYNASHQRLMVRGPRETGMCMSPFHTWRIFKEHERAGRPTPSVAVQGHHPLFFLACAIRVPYEVDEYDVAGGLMRRPLRLTPSVTWGDDFLVPADAEINIEGVILPHQLKPEGPFGEWPGYYTGQRQGEVFQVTAITHRRDPILVSIFAGHRDHIAPLRREAEAFRRAQIAVPRVRAVCVPPSANGFHCYVAIDKISDGEPRLAAMAVASIGFFKLIVVVDADIDPFNEEEVLWAVAVRAQAHRDMDVVRGVGGAMTDPSMDDPKTHSLLLIDATEPRGRPFPKRLRVPQDVMARIVLEEYVSADALRRAR